jgi:hypothetical protein
MIYKCDQCQQVLPSNVAQCPHCGKIFNEAVPGDAEAPRGFTAQLSPNPVRSFVESFSEYIVGIRFETKTKIGLIGSLILLLAVFTPVFGSLLTEVDLTKCAPGESLAIAILAVVSIILSIRRSFKLLWITGGGALAILLYLYQHFSWQLGSFGVHLNELIPSDLVMIAIVAFIAFLVILAIRRSFKFLWFAALTALVLLLCVHGISPSSAPQVTEMNQTTASPDILDGAVKSLTSGLTANIQNMMQLQWGAYALVLGDLLILLAAAIPQKWIISKPSANQTE